MVLVVQRVSRASVSVEGDPVGAIQSGLVVFAGIAKEDSESDADYLVDRLAGIRIFKDRAQKMNCNIRETGGSLLLISQFTLLADCTRGRRPSFDRAAAPEAAKKLWEHFVDAARNTGIPVETGIFQASMQVSLLNEGPVTIILNSADRIKR